MGGSSCLYTSVCNHASHSTPLGAVTFPEPQTSGLIADRCLYYSDMSVGQQMSMCRAGTAIMAIVVKGASSRCLIFYSDQMNSS